MSDLGPHLVAALIIAFVGLGLLALLVRQITKLSANRYALIPVVVIVILVVLYNAI